MKLGLFTPLFHALSIDELLVTLKQYPAITALELGTRRLARTQSH